MYTQRIEHGCLYCKRMRGNLSLGNVGNIHMVGPVPGHEGVARDSIEDRADHRPLARRLAPAAHRLFMRQLDHRSESEIDMQRVALDEDAAPDNLAWSPHSLERASAKGKVHRRLPLA